MYCLDCAGYAFCYYCRATKHKDHRVIQIRRSSYHDVVRVAEIHKVLDISGVQTYVINNTRVLVLNERPQLRSGKAVSHMCEIYGRSLLDTFWFCSLGCKTLEELKELVAKLSTEAENLKSEAEELRKFYESLKSLILQFKSYKSHGDAHDDAESILYDRFNNTGSNDTEVIKANS